MATIRDVAEAAQVSISTVSHVINETRYVRPETRDRVLQAMDQLNYRRNRLASSLRNRKTQTIGVLLPNSANPYFAEVLLGIESKCYLNEYNIIMGNAIDNPDRELRYLNVLLSRQVEGILLISAGDLEKSIDLLNKYEMPVVMVDRATERPTTDQIYTDNPGGGRLATEYLISLGHHRIACITGPSVVTPSAERIQGYRDALAAANIPIVDDYIIGGDFQHEGGFAAAQALMALPTPPTAIFACNDLMAVGAIAAVQSSGRRVPDDVSVVGYDDISLASYTNPRLTTIHQPAQEVGQLAVERLLQRINNPDGEAHYDILPVSLVERDSCTHPAGA